MKQNIIFIKYVHFIFRALRMFQFNMNVVSGTFVKAITLEHKSFNNLNVQYLRSTNRFEMYTLTMFQLEHCTKYI